MKKITLFLAFLVVSATAFAQTTTTWTADNFHSAVGFTVTHTGITDIPGTFDDYTVDITTSKPDFSDASITLTIQTNSVNTRVAPRDAHLKNSDFFDVEKYPTMTFKSTSIKPAGDNKYTLTGDLTMVGVTKPVTLTLNYRGTNTNKEDGTKTAGIQVTGEIKRSDFGFGAGFPTFVLSDVVKIKADGQFKAK